MGGKGFHAHDLMVLVPVTTVTITITMSDGTAHKFVLHNSAGTHYVWGDEDSSLFIILDTIDSIQFRSKPKEGL